MPHLSIKNRRPRTSICCPTPKSAPLTSALLHDIHTRRLSLPRVSRLVWWYRSWCRYTCQAVFAINLLTARVAMSTGVSLDSIRVEGIMGYRRLCAGLIDLSLSSSTMARSIDWWEWTPPQNYSLHLQKILKFRDHVLNNSHSRRRHRRLCSRPLPLVLILSP